METTALAQPSRRAFLKAGAATALAVAGLRSRAAADPGDAFFVAERIDPAAALWGRWRDSVTGQSHACLGAETVRDFTLVAHFRRLGDGVTRIVFGAGDTAVPFALEFDAGRATAVALRRDAARWMPLGPPAALALPPGVWHVLRIAVRAGRCTADLNAHVFASFDAAPASAGRITLAPEPAHELAQLSLAATGSLVTYPPPGELRDVPHLEESRRYRVRISGLPLWVYAHANHYQEPADPGPEGALRRSTIVAAHFASAAFAGRPVTIEIEKRGGPIRSCEVRPRRFGIQPEVSGSRCRFTLDRPRHVVVFLDGEEHPLFVWTDPPESPGDAPPPGAGTHYFAAGIHTPGLRTPLPDDADIYLAGGAVVLGTFLAASPAGPARVRIRGRGVLCGSPWPWLADRPEGWRHGLLALQSGGGRWSDSRIDGPVLLDSPSWTLGFDKVRTHIRHVKIVGTRTNNDGVWLGPGCTVRHCFMAVNDDPLRPNTHYRGTEPALAEDCVIWKMPIGSVLKCFVPPSSDTTAACHFTFRRIDVVKLEDGLGGVFTFLTLRTGAGWPLHDFTFEDIRIEDWPTDGRRRLFRCLLAAPGAELRRLTFRRIEAPVANGRLAVDGAGGRIEDVRFESCRFGSRPLERIEDTAIEIGPGVSGVVVAN